MNYEIIQLAEFTAIKRNKKILGHIGVSNGSWYYAIGRPTSDHIRWYGSSYDDCLRKLKNVLFL